MLKGSNGIPLSTGQRGSLNIKVPNGPAEEDRVGLVFSSNATILNGPVDFDRPSLNILYYEFLI